MFNEKSKQRNRCQLYGGQAKKGYDWWWHSFTAYNKKTSEVRPFFRFMTAGFKKRDFFSK